MILMGRYQYLSSSNSPLSWRSTYSSLQEKGYNKIMQQWIHFAIVTPFLRQRCVREKLECTRRGVPPSTGLSIVGGEMFSLATKL